MRLDATQRARVRRATAAPSDDPSEAGGELNIVPFLDIVTNLILFLLATTAVVLAVAQLPVTLGGGRRALAPRPPGLGLSVTLVDGGAIVATRDGQLSADCAHYAHGRVLTVGRRGDGTDWDALSACLARVKSERPEETSVVMSAEPQVAYADVVRAMDAARGPGGTRFPQLLLSAGVR